MNDEYCSGFFMKSAYRLLPILIFMLVFWGFFPGQMSRLLAAETGVLQGRILDIFEEPVENAEVYIFDSPDVKRPADFISNRTTEGGSFRVKLPAGDYWAVAIFRKGGGRFGPLGPSDKHSGDPVAFEIAGADSRSLDFIVVNLREAARKHEKKSAELIKVTGRVINQAGAPVEMAYAMAHKMDQFGTFPDYISAWTAAQGDYILYLPPGRYYLGASLGFPPKHGYNLEVEQQFTGDTDKVDLVVELQNQ
jgi:hypothetical protein